MKTHPRRTDALSDPVDPLACLNDLALSLFSSNEEFRRWLALSPGGRVLAQELPGSGASMAETIHRGLELLRCRGHIDREFFRRLMRAFPRRCAEIHRVASMWERGENPRVLTPEREPLSRREAFAAISTVQALLVALVIDESRDVEQALEEVAAELDKITPNLDAIRESVCLARRSAARVAATATVGPKISTLVTMLRTQVRC